MKSKIFIIAIALVLVITIIPAMAKGPKEGKEKPGDVYLYEFGTPNYVDGDVTLCWDLADVQPEGAVTDALKYSVVLYGDLEYNYGTVEPGETVFEEAFEVCYSTVDMCIDIDSGELTAAIAEALPEDLNSFTFSNIFAKVKGLDPGKEGFGKKRQDNVFSEPVALEGMIVYPEEVAPPAE